MAETREDTYQAFARFGEMYGAKYPKVWQCHENDNQELLVFYDFPAEHWKDLRTTNPIESTVTTIHLKNRKTKGRVTRNASLVMMFKLAATASRR